MSEGRTMPFVRVPGHDHASIGYALDAGASVVVPQVETVEQARHVVSAAKFGAANMAVDPTRTLWENQNDQAAVIIQIENEEGLRNLDAILTAVGDQIDAVWLGSLDTRVSIGLDGFSGPEPRFLEAVDLYRETLKKHHVPQCGMCLGGNWASAANKPFVIVAGDFFALLGDIALIKGARENLGPLSANGKGDAKKETGVANGD
ncbi:MAG: hypothetical protein LQ341_007257 [Variospora aurantia]|nr:MAG: hypothetical protein LQ341_007257 [Variospora aurantia]